MSESPLPQSSPKKQNVDGRFTLPGQFTFPEIIKFILEGHQVARKDWTEDAPVYLHGGLLKIKRGTIEYDLILSEIDLRAMDWYVI